MSKKKSEAIEGSENITIDQKLIDEGTAALETG